MMKTTNSASPALAAGTNDIRTIKPPLVIRNDWVWLAAVLALLALAAGLVMAWRHWRKKKATAEPDLGAPPHERARQRLEEALRSIHDARLFCFLVSDITRVYLEERFNFHAPERTTEEFLIELKGSTLLMPDQKDSLGDFLNHCDLVKFARYEPTQSELMAIYEAAIRLVDETEPPPPQPETPAPAPAADSAV